MRMRVSSNVKMAATHAVIIRADGSREVVGTIAYYHRNPLRRLLRRLGLIRRNRSRGSTHRLPHE